MAARVATVPGICFLPPPGADHRASATLLRQWLPHAMLLLSPPAPRGNIAPWSSNLLLRGIGTRTSTSALLLANAHEHLFYLGYDVSGLYCHIEVRIRGHRNSPTQLLTNLSWHIRTRPVEIPTDNSRFHVRLWWSCSLPLLTASWRIGLSVHHLQENTPPIPGDNHFIIPIFQRSPIVGPR